MKTNNLMSLDLETVPDIELIRKKYGDKYNQMSDKDMVYDVRASYNSDFLPVIYHKIVSISFTYLDINIVNVAKSSILIHTVQGNNEKEIIENFIKQFDKVQPNLISWKGKGFDVQVLNYRMMKYLISSEFLNKVDGEYKYDNYTNRYHNRHIDLMDKLACFSNGCITNLDTIAISVGLPGKFSFNRDLLFESWLNKEYKEIDDYCECDTLMVMILYLKYLAITNVLPKDTYLRCEAFIRVNLINSNKTHLIDFNSKWSK